MATVQVVTQNRHRLSSGKKTGTKTTKMMRRRTGNTQMRRTRALHTRLHLFA